MRGYVGATPQDFVGVLSIDEMYNYKLKNIPYGINANFDFLRQSYDGNTELNLSGPTWVANGLSFDGTDDYGTFSPLLPMSNTTGGTIAMLINFYDISSVTYFLGAYDPEGKLSGIRYNGINFLIYTVDGTVQEKPWAKIDAFVLFSVVKNTDTTWQMYINGSPLGGAITESPAGMDIMYLGRRESMAGISYLNAEICNIMHWNRALSSNENASLYFTVKRMARMLGVTVA